MYSNPNFIKSGIYADDDKKIISNFYDTWFRKYTAVKNNEEGIFDYLFKINHLENLTKELNDENTADDRLDYRLTTDSNGIIYNEEKLTEFYEKYVGDNLEDVKLDDEDKYPIRALEKSNGMEKDALKTEIVKLMLGKQTSNDQGLKKAANDSGKKCKKRKLILNDQGEIDYETVRSTNCDVSDYIKNIYEDVLFGDSYTLSLAAEVLQDVTVYEFYHFKQKYYFKQKTVYRQNNTIEKTTNISQNKEDNPPKTMISRFHNFPTSKEDTYGAVKVNQATTFETIQNAANKLITGVTKNIKTISSKVIKKSD